MTNWKEVHSDNRPEVIDTETSEIVVYERRNIREETVEHEGESHTGYVYEEREYDKAEYNMMLSPAIQMLQQHMSEIDLAIAEL